MNRDTSQQDTELRVAELGRVLTIGRHEYGGEVTVSVFIYDDERGRMIVWAHAHIEAVRFGRNGLDGRPRLAVDRTWFDVTEGERERIDAFLWPARPLLNAETVMAGRLNGKENEHADQD